MIVFKTCISVYTISDADAAVHSLGAFVVAWTRHVGHVSCKGLNQLHEVVPHGGVILRRHDIRGEGICHLLAYLDFNFQLNLSLKAPYISSLRHVQSVL